MFQSKNTSDFYVMKFSEVLFQSSSSFTLNVLSYVIQKIYIKLAVIIVK